MTEMRPYTVQLHLELTPLAGDRERTFAIELIDMERTSTSARAGTGDAFLDLRAQSIPGLGLTVGAFLNSFLWEGSGSQEDGLLFGRYLLARLIADGEVRALWDEIQTRRKAAKRPLRLELNLPAADTRVVSDIPFELLADESGFLFRPVGAVLVRAIRRFSVRAVEIAAGDGVLLAWANHAGENRLPQALFEQHAKETKEAAERAGLVFRAPCAQATRSKLEGRLVEGGGTPIVSLVAHGDPSGGAVWLHKEGHPAYPNDPGDPVEARDLAASFKRGGVRVALLWTCHSGKHNAVSGALATALLDPDHGDVAAVVAAHAALKAENTAALAARLFASLRAPAGGDFEQALSEARRVLPETNLQWAAPVYYARPSGGRSVRLADVVGDKETASPRVAEAPRSGEVEGAPGRWPHFRGRTDEIARGMAILRTERLVSVTGMAGMGKTEVALEIAREAVTDLGLGLGRVMWLSLDGMRQAEGVRASLAFAFGAEPKDCPNDAALARRIGGANALVVLDNAEDPLRGDRGGMRGLVDVLLRECAGLKVMLATRERLGEVRVAEEQEIRIGKLGEGDAREVFLSVAGERFVAGERESGALGEMLAWLDGHALSLVLVARQVGTMPLPALWRRLERQGAEAVQIDELFGEEVGADQDEKLRKERLVSSLNLSYRPLAEKAPGAAEMFAWLGHFPAGLPGVLVPMVFGEDGEERRAILLRKGLAEEVGRERRLGLPAPVRMYALAKARAIPEAGRAELVMVSFTVMAEWMRLLKALMGKPGAREAMESAARDVENIRALLGAVSATMIAMDALVEWIARTIEQCAAAVQFGGHVGAAMRMALDALSLIERSGRESPSGNHSIAAVLMVLGNLFVRAAQLSEAEGAYGRALLLFHGIEERIGEANVHLALGELYKRTGRLRESGRSYVDALTLYEIAGDRQGRANVLRSLGDWYVRTDDLVTAEKIYEDALDLFRALNDRLGEAAVLNSLGELFRRTSRYGPAKQILAHALAIYRAIDGRIGEANVLAGLGNLALADGDAARAFVQYVDALAVHMGANDIFGAAGDHAYMSRASFAAGRPLRAVVLGGRALQLFREIGDRYSQMLILGAVRKLLPVLAG